MKDVEDTTLSNVLQFTNKIRLDNHHIIGQLM